ncbi:kinesin-like protein KIF19 [Pollicipes pollicipes]|uniref:kinesin-like protein KIF19 n=1 Tax=Pollicipes pollicipes TaxID=41117 RepID=UPI001884BCF8|nr:kinesin-like protein KIF19 [Pollicipes pollicipes]
MVTLQENDGDKNDILRQKRRHEKHFVYDLAFGEDSNQKQLYEKTTRPLVNDVLQGYNATVFAYGPTGAGKTYTMVGTMEQPGIMVRALNELFKAMADKKDELEFGMTLSYLEIYNENIRDLLNPSSGTLDLREDAKKGTIEVVGLSEVTTMNTKEVMRLLTKGNKERTMESTAANKTSSRSHALLQVNVRQQSRVRDIHETVKVGRLYMIDLAGSERAKRTKNQGKRLQEGAHINRSLLALGNCINALAVKGAKYVNYRDSKLTRLLKDALSGNCRTVMIAHISPAMAQRDETFNTLVYADRAKNISNKVKRNVLDVTHQVSQYQNIIAELKNEIGRLKGKMDSRENEPDLTSQPRSHEQEEELRRLRNELVESFKEQMEHRKQLMEVDNVLLWLAMEFEKQTTLINELEQVRAIHGGKRSGAGEEKATRDQHETEHRQKGSDDEMSEEMAQAWDDLHYIQEEEQRYQGIRKNVEADLAELKGKASRMEEALPEKISTDEQRELLELLLKTHELEIENMEIRSNQLIKDHELRRRDLMILRYDRQRALCDEIISRQRDFIQDIESGRSPNGGDMPPELQKMYSLYQQELQGPSAQRDQRFLNGLNEVMRSPSTLSMMSSIGTDRDEKLFQHLGRRSSVDFDNKRPQTPLSLRSPNSSVPSSAASPLRLPPIRISRSPDSPPSSADRREMRDSVHGIQSVAGRRRRRGSRRPGSMDEGNTSRRGSFANGSGMRRWGSSGDLESAAGAGRRSSLPNRDAARRPSHQAAGGRRRASVARDNGVKTLPSINGTQTSRSFLCWSFLCWSFLCWGFLCWGFFCWSFLCWSFLCWGFSCWGFF